MASDNLHLRLHYHRNPCSSPGAVRTAASFAEASSPRFSVDKYKCDDASFLSRNLNLKDL